MINGALGRSDSLQFGGRDTLAYVLYPDPSRSTHRGRVDWPPAHRQDRVRTQAYPVNDFALHATGRQPLLTPSPAASQSPAGFVSTVSYPVTDLS
jgi:hypothetical protein